MQPNPPYGPIGSWLAPPLRPLDDAGKKLAFQRTIDELRTANAIRVELGLPSESLPTIVNAYRAAAHGIATQQANDEIAAAAPRAVPRVPMTMRSTSGEYKPLRVRRGENAQVTGRPQWLAYRVEEIEISGDPSRWIVHDIIVGNMSQLARNRAPIPGERFCKGGIMSDLCLTTCQIATLTVEYIGPDPDGEVFEATLVGTGAI